MCLTVIYIFRVLEIDETNGNDLPLESILDVRVIDGDLPETNSFRYKVVENAFGADKFTMITNPDGSGSLKIIKVSFSLCYKLPSTVACRHTFEVSVSPLFQTEAQFPQENIIFLLIFYAFNTS